MIYFENGGLQINSNYGCNVFMYSKLFNYFKSGNLRNDYWKSMSSRSILIVRKSEYT